MNLKKSEMKKSLQSLDLNNKNSKEFKKKNFIKKKHKMNNSKANLISTKSTKTDLSINKKKIKKNDSFEIIRKDKKSQIQKIYEKCKKNEIKRKFRSPKRKIEKYALGNKLKNRKLFENNEITENEKINKEEKISFSLILKKIYYENFSEEDINDYLILIFENLEKKNIFSDVIFQESNIFINSIKKKIKKDLKILFTKQKKIFQNKNKKKRYLNLQIKNLKTNFQNKKNNFQKYLSISQNPKGYFSLLKKFQKFYQYFKNRNMELEKIIILYMKKFTEKENDFFLQILLDHRNLFYKQIYEDKLINKFFMWICKWFMNSDFYVEKFKRIYDLVCSICQNIKNDQIIYESDIESSNENSIDKLGNSNFKRDIYYGNNLDHIEMENFGDFEEFEYLENNQNNFNSNNTKKEFISHKTGKERKKEKRKLRKKNQKLKEKRKKMQIFEIQKNKVLIENFYLMIQKIDKVFENFDESKKINIKFCEKFKQKLKFDKRNLIFKEN